MCVLRVYCVFFFQAEDGIRYLVRSRGLGDVYKRQVLNSGDNPLMVDVIICDIRMPRINGVEAIAYFRAQYPSLPVIVLTGYHDEQLASSLRKQGVVECLEKPAEREQILTSVAQAIAGRRISFYP